ncbi:LytTR family transcriptional regulator DNA-binding domain-containing protein [Roseobacter sp. YSTF-M11]|uniref:LytTR family transcriptional regulator DNA-binding domain-containing protein n=1 Tax=Roseobacter insulae TaxID=2859783 RepID=A0A9X1FY15_9RHOB|nr:MHYT domain-containing protein [Roseobacter insulae]MBW4710210.1 LytTR family transcriptional regulator DNA-binding domain-containing protein [Roseobacter insulae]
MDYLAISHNAGLIAASLVVALVAGFTGLTLTKDLSQKTIRQRKFAIALAAVALGGGIWSMHFVAMLGMQMPIQFYYDSAVTLASALLAILIVGAALSILHFADRSPTTVTLAGGLVALGILSMHYLGMAGLQLCRAVYTPVGIALSVVSAFVLCIAAFWIAYGHRTNRNILFGTLCFGIAVFAVHFVAITGTRFVQVPSFNELGPVMSNEVLALGVILSSFVIFGAFLWMSVTFLLPQPTGPSDTGRQAAPSQGIARTQTDPVAPLPMRIPCEKDGTTLFVDPAQVAFVRAEGHYTNVYTDDAQHFCVWPITEATKRLVPRGFLKVHRSYLINPARVENFERLKDNGLCRFAGTGLPPVPVSRSNLKAVREALGV